MDALEKSEDRAFEANVTNTKNLLNKGGVMGPPGAGEDESLNESTILQQKREVQRKQMLQEEAEEKAREEGNAANTLKSMRR